MTSHADTPPVASPVRSKNVRYLLGVDHLRGLAALYIVLYHGLQQLRGSRGAAQLFPEAQHPFSAVAIEGHTAVSLFMVLSGFILTYGADRRTLRYRGFLTNRVLRVIPMYVLVLLVAIFTSPAPLSLGNVLPYLLFVAHPPFDVDLGVWSAVLWSVSVEFAFYLVFPFLLRFLQRWGVRYLLGVAALLNILRLLAAGTNPEAVRDLSYWSIIGRLDQFLLGMCAAWLMRRGWLRWGRATWMAVAGLGLAGLSLALWWFNRHGSFFGNGRWRAVWPLVEGGLWAAVVLGWVAAVDGLGSRALRWLAVPGTISYSVYLLHFPVVAAVKSRGWGSSVGEAALLTVGVVVPIVAAVATLAYLVVERPFMQMRVRYLSDGDGSAAST